MHLLRLHTLLKSELLKCTFNHHTLHGGALGAVTLCFLCMQCRDAWAIHRLLADTKLIAGMQVLAAALQTVALLQLTHTQLELLQV